MAAEESSQGAALGPDFSKPAGGDPPTKPDIPDLDDVLGEFMEALCVVNVTSRALTEVINERSEDLGPCAIALRHGCQLLDTVYNRFDEGLACYHGPGDDEPDELDDEPDDELDEDATGGTPHGMKGGTEASTPGK